MEIYEIRLSLQKSFLYHGKSHRLGIKKEKIDNQVK
jgi:hypothetical protein